MLSRLVEVVVHVAVPVGVAEGQLMVKLYGYCKSLGRLC